MKKSFISISAFLIFTAFLFGQNSDMGKLTGEVTVSGNRTDTVVYLEKAEGDKRVPSDKLYKMDQKSKEFVPRVLPIIRGSKVRFKNSDKIPHNVHLIGNIREQNFMVPVDKPKDVGFPRNGEVFVLCNIHPEMEAFIVIVPNSYFARVDEDRSFSIENVPPGKYIIKTWHSRSKKSKKFKQEITIEKGQTVTVDIKL